MYALVCFDGCCTSSAEHPARERKTRRRSLDPPLEDETSGSPKATSEEDLCCVVSGCVCVCVFMRVNMLLLLLWTHCTFHFPSGGKIQHTTCVYHSITCCG